ncbi:MAG TPA: hypothetical protein VGL15_03625 [Vicinamibacteria bacterium]
MKPKLAALVAVSSLVLAAPRWVPDKQEPGRARISTYHAAPGRQLELLKWLAAREEIAREAGVPAAQVYAHLDGDNWDYLVIWPITTPEQDRKADELAAKKGFKTGFAASIEFREFLSSHSDTFVAGPTTAAELVVAAAKENQPGR